MERPIRGALRLDAATSDRRTRLTRPPAGVRPWRSSTPSNRAETAGAAGETPRQQPSERYWTEMVAEELPASGDVIQSSSHYSTNNQPKGMGWAEDEASEWSPPRDEERVDAAGESLESETASQ